MRLNDWELDVAQLLFAREEVLSGNLNEPDLESFEVGRIEIWDYSFAFVMMKGCKRVNFLLSWRENYSDS